MLKFNSKICITALILASLSIGFAYSFQKEETPVLKGSVMAVPPAMYGLWRVTSKRINTDSPVTFKEKSLDLWNLSVENNVINLSNPFSGASADVELNSVNGNTVTFTKSGHSGNKNLTDTVEITINGKNFEGRDYLRLETVSEVNGKAMKTETATYALIGEKIAGESILND